MELSSGSLGPSSNSVLGREVTLVKVYKLFTEREGGKKSTDNDPVAASPEFTLPKKIHLNT